MAANCWDDDKASVATLCNEPLDKNIVKGFPDKDAKLVDLIKHGESLWGMTWKVVVQLSDGNLDDYFLKTVALGDVGRTMCQGEYESLRAVFAVTPDFCPEPYAWGKCESAEKETYFLLTQFREIALKPASPSKLGRALARLHTDSISPTGKFGFHVRTCHAMIDQAVDFWDHSWSKVFQIHLAHAVELASPILMWPEFDAVAKLTVDHVVPRLLQPLQEGGRVLKPSLIHGNCWDGNTALDARTGEAFVFDICAFYGHSEYDIGNWRTPRHALSDPAYLASYEACIAKSEPVEDWGARHILYSLPYNIGNAAYVPNSVQRPVIYEDMVTLCQLFCPSLLKTELELLQQQKGLDIHNDCELTASSDDIDSLQSSGDSSCDESEEEEEEVDRFGTDRNKESLSQIAIDKLTLETETGDECQAFKPF